MKVLITGATGFLGSRTLETLLLNTKISSIVATGRTLKKSNQYVDNRLTYVLGDLTEKEFTQNITKGVDAIIHTAGLSSPWGEYKDFYKANVIAQQNLIEAAKSNKIDKFIFVSSPSIYFELKDKFDIKEDEIPNQFINAYAKTKRLAELALTDSYIPFVIIRPRALIGRGDTVIMPRLIRAVDEGKLRIIGRGDNVVDLTAVDNVAEVLVNSLFVDKNAYHQIYNISNGAPVDLWKKVNVILSKLERPTLKKKIPFSFIKNVAFFLEYKSKLTNKKEPPLTVYSVGTLSKNFTLDINKAKERLNYNPTVSVDQAIDDFVQWYSKQ